MTASNDRFRRLSALFDAVRDLDAAARAPLVASACADDPGLRAELEALLAHHDEAASAARDPMLAAASALRESATRPAEDAPLPASIGRFRIRGEIARGGFGVVLRGEDAAIGRDVAIKILAPARRREPRARDLLASEGRISGRLQHPGIVPVYELGDDPAEPFVAMKVVEGRTLAALLRERGDPAAERARFLAIFEQVCQAIGYAHARGVLHRDLKPHNLMVGAFGEVQVMDWGLAVALDAPPTAGESLALGTPAYIAPEQARGAAEALDPRSDVFGLGAILCEILTGAPPFARADAATTLEAARAADLADAFARIDASGADPEVVALARRCLAAAPAERPADGGAVARAIRAHLDSLAVRARDAELAAAAATARAASERKARRLTTALGALVVLVTIAGAALWVWSETIAEQRRRTADARLQAALVDAERATAEAAAATPETAERWTFAVAAAESAARLATAESSAALAARATAAVASATQRLAHARFADELRRIEADAAFRNTFDFAPVADAYRRAFEQQAGRSIDGADPHDLAAALADLPFREQLVTSLDLWALAEHQLDRTSDIEQWVLALADELDAQPWRRDCRRAIVAADRDRMVELARDPRRASAPAAAAVQLAIRLLVRNRATAALDLLEDAVQRHSTDFEIHFHLAMIHSGIGNHWQALRYASTASALRPEQSLPHAQLAQVLSQIGRHEEATAAARRALRIADRQFGSIATASDVLTAAGHLDEADAALRSAVDAAPINHTQYAVLLSALGNLRMRQERFADAAHAFRAAVTSPMSDDGAPGWSFEDQTQVDRLGAAIGAEFEGSDDPDSLYVLARFLETDGRIRDALETYERIERLAPGRRFVHDRIRQLARGLGGALASITAIEAEFAKLPADTDTAAARRALGLDTTTLPASDPHRAFAEGRIRLASGDAAGAVECLETALHALRDEPAVWRRLHAAWCALDGRERADARIQRLLDTGPAVAGPLPIPPASPVPQAPEDGAVVAPGVTLEVGGFSVADPRQTRVGTIWELRDLDAPRPRQRRFAILVEDAAALQVPAGVLAAGRRYGWRARHVATGAPPSAPGVERTLVADDRFPSPVPIDLSGILDRDIVADDGDASGDPFDPPNDWQLVVDGYGGDDTVRGVPIDGRVGVHHLAPASGPNAVALRPEPVRTIRIPIPRGRYAALLLLGAAGNGNGQFAAQIRYADETVARSVWVCVDWFMQESGKLLADGRFSSTAVLDGMDRHGPLGVERRGEARLFEGNLLCDPTREVVELVLTSDGGRFDSLTTTANLLAVTGMRLPDRDGAESGR